MGERVLGATNQGLEGLVQAEVRLARLSVCLSTHPAGPWPPARQLASPVGCLSARLSARPRTRPRVYV